MTRACACYVLTYVCSLCFQNSRLQSALWLLYIYIYISCSVASVLVFLIAYVILHLTMSDWIQSSWTSNVEDTSMTVMFTRYCVWNSIIFVCLFSFWLCSDTGHKMRSLPNVRTYLQKKGLQHLLDDPDLDFSFCQPSASTRQGTSALKERGTSDGETIASDISSGESSRNSSSADCTKHSANDGGGQASETSSEIEREMEGEAGRKRETLPRVSVACFEEDGDNLDAVESQLDCGIPPLQCKKVHKTPLKSLSQNTQCNVSNNSKGKSLKKNRSNTKKRSAVSDPECVVSKEAKTGNDVNSSEKSKTSFDGSVPSTGDDENQNTTSIQQSVIQSDNSKTGELQPLSSASAGGGGSEASPMLSHAPADSGMQAAGQSSGVNVRSGVKKKKQETLDSCLGNSKLLCMFLPSSLPHLFCLWLHVFSLCFGVCFSLLFSVHW